MTFIDLEAWGKTGENIAKYMTKGKPVMVEGRLKMDDWDDKVSGQKRTRGKASCSASRASSLPSASRTIRSSSATEGAPAPSTT